MKALFAILVTLSFSFTALAAGRPGLVVEGSAIYVGTQSVEGARPIAITGKVLTSNISNLAIGADVNIEALLDLPFGIGLCKKAVFVVTPAAVIPGTETHAHARYAFCLENI